MATYDTSDREKDGGTMNNRDILWLEDVPKSVRANVYHLEKSGFVVHMATSLQEAIKMVNARSFVAIIVDYSIPNFPDDFAETNKGLGLEFIRMLKTEEFGADNAQSRIILCTAQRESIGNDRQELDRLGIEILPKSSSYVSIVKLVEEIRMAA